jgi:hypothetical protein
MKGRKSFPRGAGLFEWSTGVSPVWLFSLWLLRPAAGCGIGVPPRLLSFTHRAAAFSFIKNHITK